ncbi:hypothetical protein G7Y79_00003g010580 [Physcia stellaris]|nr:hypothetical protein G7Y79_00003g010580 [Physcia stellaris]
MAKSENAEVRGLQLALETGKYSDFTITCCAREWKVHRVILCSQSKYFELACEEKKFKEGASRILALEEDDADMVDHMLRFLYTSYYPNDADSGQQLLVNATVYALADKYQITALKNLAKYKFESALHSGWDIVNFSEVVGMVYTTTLASDRALRDCLAPFLVRHKKDLRENEAFMGVAIANRSGTVVLGVTLPSSVYEGMASAVAYYWLDDIG